MTVLDFSNKKSTTMATKVYDFLKNEIIRLKLPPGMSISENEIAVRLQVSRTPVREAFLRLSQEDLITVYPQKGSIVSLIDLDHLEESRYMREHLEVATAILACEDFSEEDFNEINGNLEAQTRCIAEKNYQKFYELDDEFHSIIFSACNKARIWNVIDNMMSINFSRMRYLSLSEKLNTDKIISQHHEIVEAIKERNPLRAEKVVREHLNLVVIDRKDLNKKYPNYFKS
ncbi:GntR family transcriptional regulator [Anaerobacillus isosaccharinicus]|uniref:GntR family transcriptional regulator n=1 Tax=Anaerobacillus isosaccharinicus TaxID=1532552 RepID=A0A7S7LC44_9BACI|nr:GntR family transcriptional regulator [Anaerobacillus isosaccharinicus]MBA5588364.1 GntR family transcriptional regulator [Anaerobacillus isosaccharinicus]QOY38202.1 GntR family transcriptional regulator [Anaerobacillus isosaccharinicus]